MQFKAITFAALSALSSTLTNAQVTGIDIYREFRLAGEWMLMEWIHDSSIMDSILNHGCWCAKLNPRNEMPILGGPHYADSLDKICKDWFTARKCNDDLPGGSCYGESVDEYYKYDVIRTKCVGGVKYTDCMKDSCKIDKFYAKEIAEYVQEFGVAGLDQSQCLPSSGGNSGGSRTCMGDAPNVSIQVSELIEPFEGEE